MPASALKPTLFQSSLINIRTSNDGLSPAYIHDVAWYAQHKRPKRRHNIRQYVNYFHGFKYPDEPILWEYIIEIDVGLFTVVPIWRGSAFFATSKFNNYLFADVQSDNAISHLLVEFGKRGGIDQISIDFWSNEFV